MVFSGAILKQSKTFRGTLILFLVLNLWTWLKQKIPSLCCDQETTIGFPVPFLIRDGITGMQEFYILGILLDISIGVTIAIIATWIVRLFKT